MFPPIWGSQTWNILHIMAFVYPLDPTPERQDSMRALLTNLGPNLPCPGCAYHCNKHMTDNPPDVSGQRALKEWLYDFHNAVNKRTGKRVLRYAEAETAAD